MHRGFIERTLAGLLNAMEHASASEQTAERRGVLQALDPRVKLFGCVSLIVAAAVSHRVILLGAMFVVVAAAAIASHVPAGVLARTWLILFFFTAAIALPALFTTPGKSVGDVAGLTITIQGLRSAAFLVGRVETSGTLGLLLVASTPWPHLIAALRSLRVPAAVVLIIAMTYRYVFLLLRTAQEMFTARRSRSVGTLDPSERRRIATSTAGVLLGKAMALADDVYLAMRSRGFRGEVYLLDDFRMRALDWCGAALFAAAAAAAFWGGLR
jgi:cobalt/nickel transport system permease protein